ncbi:hypothetical protein CHELA1G11_13326 [Hyphomicrobiales bacterium]|nr:hypothetical protein CHELA1G2_10988 [Hyphomicrobiales bacterium]CAH1670881.1 hypothetical protein CHELA1G11_13326 [Hyphomicrobiales bacterium]
MNKVIFGRQSRPTVVFLHQGKHVCGALADFLCVVNRLATTGWRRSCFLRKLESVAFFSLFRILGFTHGRFSAPSRYD